MGLSLFPSTIPQNQALPNPLAGPRRLLTGQIFPCPIHLNRASSLCFHNPTASPGRRRAVSPGRPPPPPESEPPTGDDPTPSAGSKATVQDTVQIFFAVLFWMSLFFWASAWDGRNNGRPNKGSRFRR